MTNAESLLTEEVRKVLEGLGAHFIKISDRFTRGVPDSSVTTNRHVRFPAGTKTDFTNVKTYGDFFITLLDLFDVKTTSFGEDGQEPIVWHR